MDATKYYDKIYSFKNYDQEAGRIAQIIEEHLCSDGRRLLDVACGTGGLPRPASWWRSPLWLRQSHPVSVRPKKGGGRNPADAVLSSLF